MKCRRIFYWVACPGVCFEYSGYKYSGKECKTFKKAHSIAIGLKNRNPEKVVTITKFFIKNGKRFQREYCYE